MKEWMTRRYNKLTKEEKKEYLHKLRGRAHQKFDRLWKSKRMTRDEAYNWLAKRLEINVFEAHFSEMKEIELIVKAYKILKQEEDIFLSKD